MPFQNDYEQPFTSYYSAEDSSFVAGDSPVTLDVRAALGNLSIRGFVHNDGPGDITVNLSSDGTNFGNDITLKKYETLDLKGFKNWKTKLTHVADSSYRTEFY